MSPDLNTYAPYHFTTTRYCVLIGGAGSGKSVAAARKCVRRAHTTPQLRILVIRKVAATLGRSVQMLLNSIIHEFGISHTVKFRESKRAFTFANGSEILLSGLDDPEKIKSIQGVGSVWVEEATELLEADFNQLELRVRGSTPGYKQFTLTFNPIDEGHWLRKRFCLGLPDEASQQPMISVGDELPKSEIAAKNGPINKKKGLAKKDLFYLQTTYKDNPFLDKEYMVHLEERIRHDENLYRVYALGLWGRLHQGGLFYKSFLMGTHVGHFAYNPALPLHISFDFNVQPYITLTIWQVHNALDARQIGEMCLSSPMNTTVALCLQFISKYGQHVGGLFVYGDPAGRHSSTSNERGEGDFGVILRMLAAMKPILKVAEQAPGLVPRGLFINAILAQGFAGISIGIDSGCELTLADYQNVQETQAGTKLKLKKRDPITRILAEEYGHTSDANDYFFCMCFRQQFASFHLPARKPLPPILFGK